MDMKTEGQHGEPGLVALLMQLSKALNRRTSEELLGMRLKPYIALGYIRDHPGASQHELEIALFMDANGVVLLLNELEAGGFSVRRRDPQDRRRHIVEMTASGHAALERADKARESLEDEVLGGLSTEERATLKALVRRVLDGMLQPAAEVRS
ncbi:MAG TPA: MarR family transcriptional regulator [Candidatus Dormibacteraeota bacterium]|jgi:DNA-binding MarR family transcriptional regulator